MLSSSRLLAVRLGACSALQLPAECCWVAGARLAATATASAAADGSAAQSNSSDAQLRDQPATAAGSAAQQQNTFKQPQLSEAEQQLQALPFEELHQHIRQQFALQAAQSEQRLLMLIAKVKSAEQLQAALAVVRANHMKRARILQPHHFSATVTSALVKAAGRVGAPHSFALELLQQANQLGLSVSRSLCEDVLERCLKRRDYQAASIAWIYAQLYCGTSIYADADASAAASGSDAAAAAAAAGQASAAAAWASKSLIRLYLRGMTQWLLQGGASKRHRRRLQAELEQLAGQLEQRGGHVPKGVAEALLQAREQQQQQEEERKNKKAAAADQAGADAAGDAAGNVGAA